MSDTGINIGGPDNAFGARNSGELVWVGTNSNPTLGGGYIYKAYLNVPSTGEHTVNLFIRDAGTYVDKFMLTTNIDFEPSPLFGGTNGGLNVPPETVSPSASLTVAVTQPASGKTFANGSNSVVIVVAKPTTNGPTVTKVEFFSMLLPAGGDTKIGEATTFPFLVGWTNPAAGNYALKARVTDSSLSTATSAVVNVTIVVPSGFVTPLKWVTNHFDTGLGTFTLQSQNHEGGFDFGWSDTAHAGAAAGELGGHVVRRVDFAPYVAERLERSVSRNDDLWFRGNMWFSNVNANGDIFLGYFNTNSGARVGLKIREPTSTGSSPFRFRIVPENGNLPNTLPPETVGQYEIHWIPSGLGDGSGTLTGLVVGAETTFDLTTVPNADNFNAFGLLAVLQGTTDTNRDYYAFFDDLEYKVPVNTRLNARLLAGGKVLLSWEVPDFVLQQNDVALTSTNWVNSSDPVNQQGDIYYATNSIGPAIRWYRLKHP